MLDGDDGELALEPADQLGQAQRAVAAQARGRLVEAEHARALRQRHRDLERPALAIGELLRRDGRLLGEPDGGEHLVGLVVQVLIAGDRAAHIEAARAERRQRHHDILAGRELVEQRHDLEGARHTLAGDGVRG